MNVAVSQARRVKWLDSLRGLQVVLVGRKVYINDCETDGIGKWKGASL